MSEKEYLEYLENRSHITDSQESYVRHEELRERKNRILMLLNGDLEDEEEDFSAEEEEEESIEIIGQMDQEVFDEQDILEIDAQFSPEVKKIRRSGSEGDL